ncbi:sensor histidine kinase [Antribacter gilvus]|uniref:sensor histidine kinase n=1 Tax=Antribacter gilvus TaxID=2304675 RepID=UPI001F0C1B94|nr:sensor histidine kinase [Antribacter gilvus]
MTTAERAGSSSRTWWSHPGPDDEPAPGGPYDNWGRQVVWWDVAFAGIMLLTAASLWFQGLRGERLALVYGALGAIVAAYVVWGGPAARSRDQRHATAYVAVLIVGTAVAVTQSGAAQFLLFIAFTHIWMLLEPFRRSVIGCVIFTVAIAVGLAAEDGFDLPTLVHVAPQLLVALVFAVGLGLWTSVTMRRADEHARLWGELRAAQAELARSNHEAGALAERERLAREIHDTLAQGFTSVVMQAQAAAAALDRGDDGAARERLRIVEETGRDNLAEARALVAAFAPVPLQDASLPQALARLGSRFGAETGVRVDVHADGVPPLSAPTEVVLLRAAQEALANVRRHAGASSVVVRLAQEGDRTVLTVSDDGRGLPEDATDGFGLAGMRTRVTEAGGTLDVGPGTPGGTTLRAALPGGAA